MEVTTLFNLLTGLAMLLVEDYVEMLLHTYDRCLKVAVDVSRNVDAVQVIFRALYSRGLSWSSNVPYDIKGLEEKLRAFVLTGQEQDEGGQIEEEGNIMVVVPSEVVARQAKTLIPNPDDWQFIVDESEIDDYHGENVVITGKCVPDFVKAHGPYGFVLRVFYECAPDWSLPRVWRITQSHKVHDSVFWDEYNSSDYNSESESDSSCEIEH